MPFTWWHPVLLACTSKPAQMAAGVSQPGRQPGPGQAEAAGHEVEGRGRRKGRGGTPRSGPLVCMGPAAGQPGPADVGADVKADAEAINGARRQVASCTGCRLRSRLSTCSSMSAARKPVSTATKPHLTRHAAIKHKQQRQCCPPAKSALYWTNAACQYSSLARCRGHTVRRRQGRRAGPASWVPGGHLGPTL